MELPSLKKLGVHLGGHGRNFELLVGVINRLFPKVQLAILRLSGIIWKNVKSLVKGFMCLTPTLKTLEVEHEKNCFEEDCMKFLENFPIMENVHVYWMDKEKFRVSSEIGLLSKEKINAKWPS